jgi:hypothetical protein
MNLHNALNILKPESNTDQGIKQAYRTACKKYHPDHGGDLEMMKLVNAAHEILLKENWTPEQGRTAQRSPDLAAEVKEKWDAVKGLAGIKGEIIGTWIWVTGNTYPHKDLFKTAGFRFSGNKKAWYWHNDQGYKKRGKKRFSMDDIRSKWGSCDLETGRMAIA